MPAPSPLLAFDHQNRLAVTSTPDGLAPASPLPTHLDAPQRTVAFTTPDAPAPSITLLRLADPAAFTSAPTFRPYDDLLRQPNTLAPSFATLLRALEPHLIEIPYLHLSESDFIYKFRPAHERNHAIYAQDEVSSTLYQSRLCSAIKALARRHERTADAPIELDFGPVRYIIPSHFGFCLGVKNAIERAYETLAAHPGRRVFMLSELIHNPFVNEDLLRRGLRYLQTDKGIPFTTSGQPAPADPAAPLLWDTLDSDDIVIIPAFGATNEDKLRLVRRGLPVYQFDATCMLVEKVWKAARAYGRAGYTVIIHGKHEHEETKATFSQTRRHAPALIVRNLAEAELLGTLIAQLPHDPHTARQRFTAAFSGRHTEGFDPTLHLARVAVVNQTTLLMNETRAIIDHLKALYLRLHPLDAPDSPPRVGGSGRNDTLCYATQVNQDALALALTPPPDAAFVIGGKNSSNTYQLFRLCAQSLGPLAFFIQSEHNIHSFAEVDHYVFPAVGSGLPGHHEHRPLWPEGPGHHPRRILITGGASCPDGIIQQVITRINRLFPPALLHPIDTVLAKIEAEA